jgi:hypothetical protein
MMVLILMGALAVQAEDAPLVGTTETTESDAAQTQLSAEFGGTYASGNSEYLSLNGGLLFSHRWMSNVFAGNAGVNFTMTRIDTDGDGMLELAERNTPMQWTSQRIYGDLRYDRYFSDFDSLYFLVGANRDTFAGFDYRVHQQIGYSRLLFNGDASTVRGEVGIDYAQEGWTDSSRGLDDHFIAARVLVGFTHTFNEHVTFSDDLEMYEAAYSWAASKAGTPAFEDFRLYNTAVLSVKLSDKISTNISNRISFDNKPVEIDEDGDGVMDAAYRKLDQTTMLTFVASIF